VSFAETIRQLWIEFQEPGPRGRRAATRWDRVNAASRRSLAVLESRLSTPALRFFISSSFHDGSVVSISVSGTQIRGARAVAATPPTRVEIVVLHPKRLTPFTLVYKGVSRVVLDMPGDDTLFANSNDSQFEWGYDRLSADGPDAMRHEILFSSGAALDLSFRQLILRRDRGLKGRGGRRTRR
jgi:hypothetical protein